MTRALFVIPGDLATLTGGYGYDRRVLALLPSHGIDIEHRQAPASFPTPGEDDIEATIDLLRGADPGTVLLVDGLAYGALPADRLATIENPIVALIHHPLGLETGLDGAMSRQLIDMERATLARADHIVVTSQTTRDTLVADFAAPGDRVTVAEPGVDVAPRARGSGGGAPVMIAVGAISPRKGFDILTAALAGLGHLDWRLRIIGGLDRAPEAVTALRAQIAASGLGYRIDLAGELSARDLAVALDTADLFVLSSLYEGYGMALAEAMARGLPIVATTGGAAAKTVPDDAALKVAPGDAAALRTALESALSDSALRARLSEASWRAGTELPRWETTAAIMARVIENVARPV